MDELETALNRLDGAVGRLEQALANPPPVTDMVGDISSDLPVLQAERDQLAQEVQTLRERATRDAELRSQAATAVREALRDLRGAVGQEAPANA